MFNINDIFSINGSLHKPLPSKNLPQPDLDDACILQLISYWWSENIIMEVKENNTFNIILLFALLKTIVMMLLPVHMKYKYRWWQYCIRVFLSSKFPFWLNSLIQWMNHIKFSITARNRYFTLLNSLFNYQFLLPELGKHIVQMVFDKYCGFLTIILILSTCHLGFSLY